MPILKNSRHPDSVSSRVSRALQKSASKKLHAFTLVELIVVITILAILATIGFLALSGYTQDAKDASVKANVRSVHAAISAESALTGNSPRHYVIHDAGAALSDGTVAYVDGNPAVLTGGAYGTANTNYSAGNPDWVKLKLNPDKFKLSSFPSWMTSVFAAYDPKLVSVGAIEAPLSSAASGRKRSASFFQVTGIAPSSGFVSVIGNFPLPSSVQLASGAVVGLVKSPTGTVALVDGGVLGTSGSSSGDGASRYPGCDTNDIYLTGSNQYWAACNVGATNAWTGGVTLVNCSGWASDCDWAYRNTLGSYFQWGRNDDVTATGVPTSIKAIAGTSAGGVGHSNFITDWNLPYDWILTQSGNLWGGWSTSVGSWTFTGQTVSDQAAMKGPCANGYHVPTQAEWWFAINTLNATLINTADWQIDTKVASTLKMPLAGVRNYSTASYDSQGTYGYYWSSTTSSGHGGFVLITTTHVSPANGTPRARGLSVRCLKN